MSPRLSSTPRRQKAASPSGVSRAQLTAQLEARIVGQPDALAAIIPRVQMWKAGLSPEGRPAGVFMLLGPSGSGKTATVEALAEVIHGSSKNVLRIDCGEYQMEHEVAKLIGAPPGYLGHRETQPGLTQIRINQVMSDRANLAILLFDEIEKAAPSLLRLLLGVLDKGTLSLGDNTKVQFEKTLIFFTSNLGAADISREMGRGYGLASAHGEKPAELVAIEKITTAAVKKRLSPELINRIDAFLTYRPLTEENVREILEIQLQDLANHLSRRLANRCCYLQVPTPTRQWLIEKGYSKEYGARELKRTLARYILEPLSDLIADDCVPAGAIVRVTGRKGAAALTLTVLDENAEETRGTIASPAGTANFIFSTAGAETDTTSNSKG